LNLDEEDNSTIDGYGSRSTDLPFFLFSVSFTISMAAMLLIPITFISHEILLAYPNNYYVKWLDRGLIFDLWNCIFLGANLSLFVLIPFGYFYHEAEGLGGFRGVLAKLYEATIVFGLVSIMIVGFMYVAHQILSRESQYLPFSYSLISTLGSVAVLVSIPLGFTTLTKIGFQFKTPFVTKESNAATRRIIKYEIFMCKLKLQDSVIDSQERSNLQEQLRVLTQRKLEASRANFYKSFSRNFLSLFFTLVNLLFPLYIVLHTFIQLAKGIFDPKQGDELYNFLQFEQAEKSFLGSLVSLVETTVTMYLMTSAFVGFYSIPWISSIKLRPRKTSMRKIAINMTFIQLLSSSFPVVARILGLTSFDLMGYYSNTNHLRSEMFNSCYKVAFMMAMMHQYFIIFPTKYFYETWISFFGRYKQVRQTFESKEKFYLPIFKKRKFL